MRYLVPHNIEIKVSMNATKLYAKSVTKATANIIHPRWPSSHMSEAPYRTSLRSLFTSDNQNPLEMIRSVALLKRNSTWTNRTTIAPGPLKTLFMSEFSSILRGTTSVFPTRAPMLLAVDGYVGILTQSQRFVFTLYSLHIYSVSFVTSRDFIFLHTLTSIVFYKRYNYL